MNGILAIAVAIFCAAAFAYSASPETSIHLEGF